MAITKIWAIKDNLRRVLKYTENKDKTNEEMSDGVKEVLSYTTKGYKTGNKEYITGINCYPETALQQMINTKTAVGKNDGILAFHAVQSFKPGEVSPDDCHNLGVKLARMMWGDEYEVVVSTHLDKAHLHNHFVVNSVSFVTGKKFNSCKEEYYKFRNYSDDLCNGLNLSIIESKRKGISYAEWNAASNGKPYFRQLIKHDVDVVLSYARNMDQFINGLTDMGYEVNTDGKYISLKHPNGKRFRRLYKLLRDGRYDEEHIYEKLYNNMLVPMVKVQDCIKSTYYDGDHKKLKGIRALYFKYMYMLGIIHTKDLPQRYPSKELRKDLIKMDKITSQNTFLGKHDINYLEDLVVFRESLLKEKEECIKRRKTTYNKIKRVKDVNLKKQYETDRDEFTSRINEINKEIKICEDIQKDTPDIEEKLKKIEEVKQIDEERNKEYERRLNL